MDFIRVGTTGREEVVQKLGWTDVGIKDERLFLGRWVGSSWGVFFGGVAPAGTLEQTDRHWGGHNLLIEFDEKGVVKRYSVFGDAELVKQLSAWVAQRPEQLLDLSSPIEIRVDHNSGVCTMVLAKDSLEFHELHPGWHSCEILDGFKISPTKISALSLSGLIDKPNGQPDPENTNVTLHFTENTRVGKKVNFSTDVPTIMSLVKYLAQTRPR